MNKKFKIVLITIAIIAVLGFAGYNYIMHGGARDIQAEKTEYTVASSDIISEFSTNPDQATKKYLNKAIEISGKVTDVKDNVATIDETILCEMISLEDISADKTVKIKGRVVGFDDLFGEIKMDACSISK
jgi:flagellar basal body-associated protein FliL